MFLQHVFAVSKERKDSSKLTTAGRRKREKSLLECGSFVKTVSILK
jgi:hypothetical protein